MATNSIKINSDVNTVNIQLDNNRITVVNPDCPSVNITQPVTNVIQVATPGVAGSAGPPGSAGPVGPSGSFATGSFVTTSSFNSFTSSIESEVNSLTSATSSYVINSQTGSFTTTSSFNTFTSSIESEVNSLTSVTSSYVINSQTGSFATTGSNNFIGNQVITGSLTVSGSITATSGSFTYISGTVANIIWTIDFTDGELSTRLYTPYNLSIDSVDNVFNSPTTNITSSGLPYTLGNAITGGTAIDVTASISSVINLNITR